MRYRSTPENELIEKIKYEQWNGELPTVTGSTPIISLEP